MTYSLLRRRSSAGPLLVIYIATVIKYTAAVDYQAQDNLHVKKLNLKHDLKYLQNDRLLEIARR